MNNSNMVRIKYRMLNKYIVTLKGIVKSWDGNHIIFLDDSYRTHHLNLDNMIRLEPFQKAVIEKRVEQADQIEIDF